MSETWIVADHHLGENRFKIMQRPFSSPDEMFEELVVNHNSLVHANDLVIVNGDVCYQLAPEWLPRVEFFNGRKILIRGNHDRVFTDADLKPYFEKVIEEGDGMEMTSLDTGVVIYAGDTEIPLWITHYPGRARENHFNLVGHVHGAWKYQLNSLNVGVDVHHFYPVNIKDIPFYFQAITKFYDDDVWAAYHYANEAYRNRRGVRGSYIGEVPTTLKGRGFRSNQMPSLHQVLYQDNRL